MEASRPATILTRRHLGTIKGQTDGNAILIVGILLFAVGSIGSVFLDIKRRNLRATPTRRRRQHRWEGSSYGDGTGGGDDGRDQSADWGSGTWSSSDQGGDWSSGGDGGGGGSD